MLREQGYDAALATTGAGALAFEILPQGGTRLAFVSRMDGGGIAQIRRAVRRVQGRLGPEVPVLAGLWNADLQKSEPEALARSLGVQRVAFTLAEAVAAARERWTHRRSRPSRAVPDVATVTAPAVAVLA